MSQPEGRIAHKIIDTLVTQVLTWGMAAFVNLYLPRYLKDEGMGQWGIVSSWMMLIGVIIPLGTSPVIVKEIARDRTKTSQLLAESFLLRLILGILAMPLAYLLAMAMHYTPTMRLLMLIAIPGMLFGVLNDVFMSVYQGREEVARINRIGLMEKIVYSVAVTALVFVKAPLWAIVGVSALSGLVTFILYSSGLKALWKSIRWPHVSDLRSLAIISLPFMGAKVFQTVYGQTDAIVLGALATDQEAGWYTVCVRLVGTAMFFPMSLIFVMTPALNRLFGQGDQVGFTALARKLLDLTIFVGLPISAVAVCLPQGIIAVLYGPSFANAAPVLAVSGAGMLIYSVAVVLATLMIAIDQQAMIARGAIVACLFGIPLCVVGTWAGHRFWGNGALGAILTDLVVEIYLVVVYFQVLPRELFDRSMILRFARYVLAAVPMVLGLYLSLGTPLGLWGAVPCAVVYVLACYVLRCWTREDLQMLRGILMRRTA